MIKYRLSNCRPICNKFKNYVFFVFIFSLILINEDSIANAQSKIVDFSFNKFINQFDRETQKQARELWENIYFMNKKKSIEPTLVESKKIQESILFFDFSTDKKDEYLKKLHKLRLLLKNTYEGQKKLKFELMNCR